MIPQARNIQFRVRIYDENNNPVDITSRVVSLSFGVGDVTGIGTADTGVDAVVGTAEISLVRDDTIKHLFRDYAVITVESSVTPDGSPTAPLSEVWRGYLGDAFTWSGSLINLTARDPAKLLQDTQLDNITTYGSESGTPLETVIQQIMTQHLGSAAPALALPASPNALVSEFTPHDQSVWDAIQGLANRIGWYLGFMRTGSNYELTLLEPPRTGAPPHMLALGWEDIVTEDLTLSTLDVRNSITVEYWDDAAEELARITKQNNDSIQNVTGGVVKHSHITVETGSGINTAASAERLADAFLADLSHTLANTRIELPYSPDVHLFTELSVTNPARTAGTETYSVNSVQHDVSVSDHSAQLRTTVLASGQVIGGRRKWLDREPRPGSPGNPSGPHLSQLRAPKNFTAMTAAPGIIVSTDGLSGVGAVGMELYASSAAGFTPASGNLLVRGSNTNWNVSDLTSGTRFYFRAREYDSRGGVGPWSAEVSAVSGGVPDASLSAEVRADLAYAVIQGQHVESGRLAWDNTAQTVAAREAFWDEAAAITDGTLETGTVTSRTATSVTQSGKDWAALGIQPGDQISITSGAGEGQVRAVISVSSGTLTVSEAWSPLPGVGAAFNVGRVSEVSARTETRTIKEIRDEIGRVETNLNEDALTSHYSSVRQTAEVADASFERQESDLLLTGVVDSATASSITDSNGNFVTNGLMKGDVILITESDSDAEGVQRSIASLTETQLILTEDFPSGKIPAPGDSYIVGRVQRVASSSATQTADGLIRTITNLNKHPDANDPSQFLTIRELAGEFTVIAGELEDVKSVVDALDAGYGHAEIMTMGNQTLNTVATNEPIVTVQVRGLAAIFTAISANTQQIDLVASKADDNFAQISVNANAITQRVVTGSVINSILINEQGIKLDGSNIAINGDTTFTGNVRITDPNQTGTRLEVFDKSNDRQLAIGNIGGLKGAGSGDRYGMWGQWGTSVRMLGVASFWPFLNYNMQEFVVRAAAQSLGPKQSRQIASSWITLDLPNLPSDVRRTLFVQANNVLAGTDLGIPDGTGLPQSGYMYATDFRFQIETIVAQGGGAIAKFPGDLTVDISEGIPTSNVTVRIRMVGTLWNTHPTQSYTPVTNFRFGYGSAQLSCLYVLGTMSP